MKSMLRAILAVIIISHSTVLAAENCPSLDCPREYQLAPTGTNQCPECAAPNCGGFAGQECENNNLVCLYPLGSSGGYCVKRIETGEVSTEDCVMCPQVMPECSQGTCAQGSQCMVVPQSCRQCARTECVPVNSADIGASSTCVPCNKMIPQCRCKAHQKCVIHPMTCEKCSWAECV